MEPCYNEDLLLKPWRLPCLSGFSLYQGKKLRNWQSYLVIRWFCYIRPLYNEVPLYCWQQMISDTVSSIFFVMFNFYDNEIVTHNSITVWSMILTMLCWQPAVASCGSEWLSWPTGRREDHCHLRCQTVRANNQQMYSLCDKIFMIKGVEEVEKEKKKKEEEKEGNGNRNFKKERKKNVNALRTDQKFWQSW